MEKEKREFERNSELESQKKRIENVNLRTRIEFDL